MPGGRRNPLSVSHIIEQLGDAVQTAKDKTHSKGQQRNFQNNFNKWK
jgi:hypothetical protein